jgi:hypothetical protein
MGALMPVGSGPDKEIVTVLNSLFSGSNFQVLRDHDKIRKSSSTIIIGLVELRFASAVIQRRTIIPMMQRENGFISFITSQRPHKTR